MSKYYYIDKQGWQHGPVEKEQLKGLGITPDTMVWGEGMSGWKRAIEVPEITVMFQRAPENPLRTPPPVPESARQQPRQENAAPRADNRAVDENPLYPKPSTYLWLGICTTILCCLPFGIVSIVYGAKVDNMWFAGRYNDAMRYSSLAKNWGIASAATAAGVWLIYLLVVATAVDRYYF